ncbi:peptidoglycan D,D-transpeptidase FtsI family protein [Prochlorococcus marinus]|uniref:Cell division protein FtsI n=1 Tax=Prochlorococcus marinus XMU1408 TaxID=2213228 RepID=A0A318RFM5_PROMR|nr:penicillin-binding protein 2 [Prochlorococcus marinus]MBW3041545.1 cell division protein FtsI [Prochlorococcus marinus str. XMU1408]PYE02703.1 cell division protein FtsI [Prochlorococcus marinus XMU1408]
MTNFNSRDKRMGFKVKTLSPLSGYRFRIVFFILCLGLGGLFFRVGWIQLLQSEELKAKARVVQTEKKSPLGTRRSILDRNGKLVAIDEKRFKLWAHPRYFNFPGDSYGTVRKPVEVAKLLSLPLSKSVDDILKDFGNYSSGVKLADGLTQEKANEIKKLGISGIDLEAYPQRLYPHGSLFANVVGFLDLDRRPQAGLELSLDRKLRRLEKTSVLSKGADGTPLPIGIKRGVFDEDQLNLQLTLDVRLQEVAVKEISKQVKEWNAKKGVVIVMNIDSGELLALASAPSYDPNKYWEYSPSLFKEWSVQELFEPGSTFKPINLALALEEGVINPNGEINDDGLVTVGGWPLSNWDRNPNGILNFAEVLQVSSNVGMVKIMRKLNPTSYWQRLKQLGIDEMPETDLPGAVAGHIKSKQIFVNQPIEPAVASFGQGFSITPLKLAQLHALIANGGKLVTPHITKGLKGDYQSFSTRLPESKQVLTPEATKTVLGWMETVVEKGSGIEATVPGYRIGGKTGTAQKSQDGKNYDSKICSFVASLPIDDPRFVVLVVVDEPQKPFAYGSTVAVPVAKKIIETLLVIEQIPPSTGRIENLAKKS